MKVLLLVSLSISEKATLKTRHADACSLSLNGLPSTNRTTKTSCLVSTVRPDSPSNSLWVRCVSLKGSHGHLGILSGCAHLFKAIVWVVQLEGGKRRAWVCLKIGTPSWILGTQQGTNCFSGSTLRQPH